MKVHNANSVRLGTVTYPPSSQTEEGFNDLPEGPGLDSLLAMGAVTKLPHRASKPDEKKVEDEKPDGGKKEGGGKP